MGKLTLLGTGGSTGVPLIGCFCPVCTSSDPKDRRLRPSVLLQAKGKILLIDPGPDTREHCLKHHITHLDGVIITHTHYDHVAGIDELRVFNLMQKRPLPCLLSLSSYKDLNQRMSHLMSGEEEGKSLAAKFSFQILSDDFCKSTFCDISFTIVTYEQGGMKVTGYVMGDLAYLTDVRDVPESVYSHLQGIHTLIISAQKHVPTSVHLSIDEAIFFGEKIEAKTVILTHISHDLAHFSTQKQLPKHVELGFDGMEVNFSL